MLPVVLGVDPALGGGCAVVACALGAEKLWVLDCDIRYGLSKTEQILEQITHMARKYRPHLVIVEIDAMNKAVGNDDRLRATGTMLGFSIKPHLTAMNKHVDQVYGVASMDQSFRLREISIPWKDEETRRHMEELVNQLRKWRPDVKTRDLKQDAVMALWFIWKHWMTLRKAHEPVQVPVPVPSWLAKSPTQWLERVS
jgi:hypothetical protein